MMAAILYFAMVPTIEDASDNACKHEDAHNDFHGSFKVVDIVQTRRSAYDALTEILLENMPGFLGYLKSLTLRP